MHCMLAVSIALAEERVGVSASLGEGAGVRRVTEVHHLIDGEESLVASLLSLTQFLCEQACFNDSKMGLQKKCVGSLAVLSQCLSASQSQ